MEVGEFDLIELIKQRFTVPEGVLGIGDDCAVLPQRAGMETLVSTDMLMDGVHFLIDDVDPFSLGWKSAAVNVSDIAGMGGRPVGSFLSFALPKSLSAEFIISFIDGYKALSDQFDCPLLGGDTTSSLDRLCISVTVMGECAKGACRKRSDARVGDLICTTGFIGDSAAGLNVILKACDRGPLEAELVRRHYRPVPRVDAGLALAAAPGVHAMMDISDGIGSDLRHILKASGKSARVDVDRLPLSAQMLEACGKYGWDALHLALDGGEDYELLFTAAPGSDLGGVPHHVIGEILPPCDEQIFWEGTDEKFSGFHHF